MQKFEIERTIKFFDSLITIILVTGKLTPKKIGSGTKIPWNIGPPDQFFWGKMIRGTNIPWNFGPGNQNFVHFGPIKQISITSYK